MPRPYYLLHSYWFGNISSLPVFSFFVFVFVFGSSADSKRVYCTRVTLGHKRTELVQNAKGPGQRASGTVLVVRKVVIFPADLGEVTFRVY